MARCTETGAFTGANARPLRKSASLPGVVGPTEGKELARLIDAATIKTTAPVNNVRTAIFTGYLNSAIGVACGVFFKNRWARQAQSSGATSKEQWFGGRGRA